MNLEYCISTCTKYERNWINYKKAGSFSSQNDCLAAINLCHKFLFGYSENIMCPSCRKNMVTRVFSWFEGYKLNNTQPKEDLSRLTRKQLIEKAKEYNITLPRNVNKSELIKLINDRV